MKFGLLDIDPAENPAVLDTGTWDAAEACRQIRAANYDWTAVGKAIRESKPALPQADTFQPWNGSASISPNGAWFLASLHDGQSVILRVGREENGQLGKPLDTRRLPSGESLVVFSTSAAVLDPYCRLLKPGKGPQALGATPRLGIGTRMTTQVWPGIFDAMTQRSMAANSIQNSIRELSLLDDLLAARPPETNYSTGIGTIEAGWTGSTYEGLWVAGVLAVLKSDQPLRYGADADHVQVKRGAAGIERAKRVIRAARYYSFFTLDMADVLDYSALSQSSTGNAEPFLMEKFPTRSKDVVSWSITRSCSTSAAGAIVSIAPRSDVLSVSIGTH